MSVDRKGFNILLSGSTEDKDSNSLTDRDKIMLKHLIVSYLLYSTECLILAVKLLIFCILMNVSSSKSVKRHCIYKEFKY